MEEIVKLNPEIIKHHTLMLFNVSDEKSLEKKYPFYPLDSPGLPLPGKDFIELGKVRGDPDVVFTKSKSKKKKVNPLTCIPYTAIEYRAALHTDGYTLPIKHNNKPHSVSFLPGHIWGTYKYGPKPATVMVLGKQIGKEEERSRKNFSGETSQLFMLALEEAGIDWDEYSNWYVANLLRFNPPFLVGAIPADWIKDCLPILHQELRIVRPTYLLCLGSEATKAVLGRTKKITSMQGQINELTIPINRPDEEPATHTIKVICCVHPAHINRNPEEYPQFLSSMRFFARAVTGKSTELTEDDIERDAIRTDSELTQVIDRVRSELNKVSIPAIAFDCEWHGDVFNTGYLRTIQFSHKAKYGAAIVLRQTGGAENTNITQEHVVKELKRLVSPIHNATPRIIGHNLRADLKWLIPYGLDLREQFDAPDDFMKTAYEGGFDTMLAVHSIMETGPLKLEVAAAQLLGTPRYDFILDRWLEKYCEEKKIKRSEIEGYGDVNEEILLPYCTYDVDITFRLYERLNGTPNTVALLDYDRFGNCSREAFWITQRANLPFLEMERNGLLLDKELAESYIVKFETTKSAKLSELRNKINWPDFNPESSHHRRALLFGENFTGKIDKTTGDIVNVLPTNVNSFNLLPIKGSKKARTNSSYYTYYQKHSNEPCPGDKLPSTDKEVITILSSDYKIEELKLLLDVKLVSQALKFVLKPASKVYNDEDEEIGEEYEKGLLSYIDADGRIRTNFYPLETGRVSSSKPNLQNVASKDHEYSMIMGADYSGKIRNIFIAKPNHLLIECDASQAEISLAAWLSQDSTLIEHIRRGALPEDDPDCFDLHSYIATKTFGINCSPTKKALKELGLLHLRTGSKRALFGWFYGIGATSLAMKAREDGADITTEEAQQLIDTLKETYPTLRMYFDGCAKAAKSPGYTCNCFGRYRRFPKTSDEKLLSDYGRQAMNMGMQCISKGQYVLTNKGYKRIETLVNKGEIIFPSVYGKNNKGIVINSGSKEIWNVKTYRSPVLKTSAEHIFFVYSDITHGIIEKKCKDLKIGDWVVESHTKTTSRNKKFITDDIAYLVGVALGDGGRYLRSKKFGKSTALKLRTNNKEYFKILSDLHFKIFNERMCYILCNNEYSLEAKDGLKAVFDSLGIGCFNSSNVFIPDVFLTANDSIKLNLLAGLFDTDGSHLSPTIGAPYSAIVSTSERLIVSAYMLLSSLGFNPSLRGQRGRKNGYKYLYKLCICGTQLDHLNKVLPTRHPSKLTPYAYIPEYDRGILPPDYISYAAKRLSIGFSGIGYENKFIYDAINKKRGSSIKLAELSKKAGLQEELKPLTYRFDKIKSVINTGKLGQTYDVQITDGVPAFSLQGVLVHNSGVADTVSIAMANLYHYRETHDVKYDLVLPVHDSIISEVPYEYAAKYYHEVLPTCMNVPIYPAFLNGRPIPNVGPYKLGIDRKVYRNWGTPISLDLARELGLPGSVAQD